MAKLILGFAGEMACGKGTAAKYIEEKYLGNSHRFSTMLRDVLDRLHLEKSRENMQKISQILRDNFGDDLLARVIFEDVKNDQSEIVVIDGIRRMPDIKYLKELPQFKLVHLEAAMGKRYERIVRRGENADDNSKTFEQFQKEHQSEAELRIKDLKEYADFIVDNNGTIEALHRQIDEIIKECENSSA